MISIRKDLWRPLVRALIEAMPIRSSRSGLIQSKCEHLPKDKQTQLLQPLPRVTCSSSRPSLWLPLVLLQSIHVLLTLGSPKLDRAVRRSLTSTEQRGKITALDLLAAVLLVQPSLLLAFLGQAHCWLIFNLSVGQPSSPSAKLLSSQLVPTCTGTWRGCSSAGAGCG